MWGMSVHVEVRKAACGVSPMLIVGAEITLSIMSASTLTATELSCWPLDKSFYLSCV